MLIILHLFSTTAYGSYLTWSAVGEGSPVLSWWEQGRQVDLGVSSHSLTTLWPQQPQAKTDANSAETEGCPLCDRQVTVSLYSRMTSYFGGSLCAVSVML